MTRTLKPFSLLLCLLLGTLFLSACKSSPKLEPSRSEYDYVPPVMITEVDEPVAQPTEVESVDIIEEDADEDQEEGGENKKGFFSRLFSRSPKEDSGEAPTVVRVGDNLVVLDEEGNPIDGGQPTDNVYRLKVGDTLFISLSGSAGLDEQIETRIDGEGSVKLRFIGSVKAKGLSTTQLEREIESEYTERQKIYKDLTVRVVVPNTFYFIGGEIRQPGRFPLVGRVTLSQAVVAAGNFTEWADPSEVILVRNNERVMINYKKIRKNPNLDVELLAGDVITVERSTF